jgi:hypothetical protein
MAKRKEKAKEVEHINPVDHVQKITELEGAKFAAVDAEIRNHLQGMKILEQEMQLAEIAFREQQGNRQLQRASLQAKVNAKESEYKNFVASLAEKYGLDEKQLAIDPDTLIIRDLRPEEE